MKHSNKAIWLLAALCLAGCAKQRTTTLQAVVDNYRSAAKVEVSAEGVATWSAEGERVWVNGMAYGVEYADGKAVIRDVEASDGGYQALYPASMVRSRQDAASVSVSLDSVQPYRTLRGVQQVQSPMAAQSADGQLAFTNLCALVRVNVTNPTDDTLQMKRITLSSATAALSGDGTVSFAAEPTLSLTANTAGRVSLSFAAVHEKIAPAQTRSYYIVVPAFATADLQISLQANSTATNYAWSKRNNATSLVAGYLVTAPEASADFTDVHYFFGSGTEDDPYLISNSYDLLILQQQVGKTTTCHRMTNGIDCSDITLTPIGNASKIYMGHFMGGGHTVTLGRVSVTELPDEGKVCGLFGLVSDARIEDLTVAGSIAVSDDVPSSYPLMVGGVAGKAIGVATFTRCHNEATISATANGPCFVGGIVGMMADDSDTSVFSGLSNAGAVTAESSYATTRATYTYRCAVAGGVFGFMGGESEQTSGSGDALINSCNSGSVTARYTCATADANTRTAAGGLVGSCNGYATIGNCYNTAVVTAEACTAPAVAGGIVGGWTATTVSNKKKHVVEVCLNTTAPVISITSTGDLSAGHGLAADGSGQCNYSLYPAGTTAVPSTWTSSSCKATGGSSQPADLNALQSKGSSQLRGSYTAW